MSSCAALQTWLPAPSLAVCGLLNGAVIDPPGIELRYQGPDCNVYRGPVREQSTTIPHQACFVMTTSSQAPVTERGQGPSNVPGGGDKDMLNATVTLYLRGQVNAFEAGEDWARGIWRYVQRNVPPGYIECACTQSEPQFMGLDNTEHPHWTIQLRLVREE